MREIKFRCWDFKNEEMIPGDALAFEHYAPLVDLLSVEGIMQYTGLKDKNGVEIYEGDIMGKCGHPNMKIVFNDGCFVGKSTNLVQAINWKPSNLVSLTMLHFEVVGNIYKNPELIE